ncbi:MAG TPA: hypothetical protein VNN22_14665 [Verrucomicrobiae bacterium]|nr:hypothetical protein [Verrucomicrobiae bacterium]
MKIHHLCTNIVNPWRIINHFGNALPVQGTDGKRELVGGSDGDYTAAKEWVSLSAHEIVFKSPVKRRQRHGFSFVTGPAK